MEFTIKFYSIILAIYLTDIKSISLKQIKAININPFKIFLHIRFLQPSVPFTCRVFMQADATGNWKEVNEEMENWNRDEMRMRIVINVVD